jgi:hypothetical protein
MRDSLILGVALGVLGTLYFMDGNKAPKFVKDAKKTIKKQVDNLTGNN